MLFKQLLKKLYNYYFLVPERTLEDMVHEIKKLSPQERLRLQIKAFRFPEAKPLSEMEELLALRSILEAEPFLNYLENRKYNYMTAHIQEPTPEGRLALVGRYLEISELYEGIKTSKERSEEKAVDDAINHLEENQ